jgi:hypothetical protein
MPINAINAVIGGKRMKRHSKIRQGRRTRNVGGDQVDQEPRGLIAYVDIELAIEESLPFSVGSLVEKNASRGGTGHLEPIDNFVFELNHLLLGTNGLSASSPT